MTIDEQSDVTEVWDINWASLQAFLSCRGQWRFSVGFGWSRRTGLDMAAAAVICARRSARRARALVADLVVMERAAVAAFDEIDASRSDKS